MVDVRTFEGHHIGDQTVLIMQLLILLGSHGGIVVPAEGVQGFGYKSEGIISIQAAITFELLDQL
ncbi:hypothetical protein D3C72_1997140 [compost metagenome]